ncbi:hypothetical protein WA026_011402 [Henosepilachna vigintioctopunctata]|uniref:Uncharacterized protein n=1 Tax=Henosepilachna vigintioctopunctata TaxID=420089 RepID=A0AAW1TLS9_9CUCU
MSSRQKKRERQRKIEIKKLHLALICWTIGLGTLKVSPAMFSNFDTILGPLIVLVISTILITIPQTFFEIGIAQYSRRGCIKVFDAAPAWRGIGILGVVSVFISSIRSVQICTYFLIYTLNSLRAVPPWSNCGEQNYLSFGCYSFGNNRTSHENCIEVFDLEHCENIEWFDSADLFWRSVAVTKFVPAQTQYKIELIVCCSLTLIAAYICVRNSMDSFSVFSGFLVYAPAFMQAAVVLKSFTNPGSMRALKYIFTFSRKDFFNVEVWMDMITFSLMSVGNMGGLKTLAKGTYFRHPTNSEAVLLNLICTTFTLLYGALFFNLVGTFSFEMNADFNVLTRTIVNFNFIEVPSAIAFWELSTMYLFFFFFSDFLIVFRNFAIQFDLMLSSLYEAKNSLRRYNNTLCVILCCFHFAMFIIVKLVVSERFMNIVTYQLLFIISPIIAFYSGIFLCCFYGSKRFVDDIHFMLGLKPTIMWQISWYFATVIYLYCFLHFYMKFIETTHKYFIPLLIIITLFSAFPLLYIMLSIFVKWQKKQSIVEIFKPTKDWGPDDEILRRSRDMFSAQDMTKEYLYRQQRLKLNITNPTTSGGTSFSMHTK